MPPADHKPERGVDLGRVCIGIKHPGPKVRPDVIDTDQRDTERPTERLGRCHADQQRADQTRSVPHRDRINLVQRDAGVFNRLLDHPGDPLGVGPAGQFRNDAAVFRMDLVLAGDHAGENISAIAHDRCSRLVA